MKKLLLSAAMLCTMAASASADVVTTYVAAGDKAGLKTAINQTIGAGNTHVVVICKSLNETKDGEGEVADATVQFTYTGSAEFKIPSAGTLVLRSNQTDIDKLPYVKCEFGANAIDYTVGLPSLKFENIQLDTRNSNWTSNTEKSSGGGGYIVSNKQTADNYYGADSVIFRNCDIMSGRAIFREENNTQDATLITTHHIKHFIFEGNRCHRIDIEAGNAWRPFYFVSIPDLMDVSDNIFYDTPYAGTLITWHKSVKPDGTASTFNIHNNTFLMSGYTTDGGETGTEFTLVNCGSYLNESSIFNIYNNMFLGEEKGMYATPVDNFAPRDTSINMVRLLDSEGLNTAGFVTTRGNYFSKYVKLNAEGTVARANSFDDCQDLVAAEHPFTFDMFYDAASSNFTVEKGNCANLYEAGVPSIYEFSEDHPEGVEIEAIPTYVGAGIMYVDKFPVKADVKVAVNGPEFVSYTITPSKATYFAGDEVTITLKAGKIANKYLTVTPTVAWSDGSTELERTITVPEGGLDLTATVTVPDTIISAFDFQSAKGANQENYKADVCAKGYQANMYMMIPAFKIDTLTIRNYNDTKDSIIYKTDSTVINIVKATTAAKNFQTRDGKFGEDAADDQISIASRRTNGVERNLLGAEYAVVEFSTKNKSGINFSCMVGTDNSAYNKQNLEYSLDGTTWTEFATINLKDSERAQKYGESDGQAFGWAKLAGDLPTACENQESVKVRIIGVKGGEPEYIYNDVNEFDPATSTTFEYTGDILITSKATTAVKGDVNGDGNVNISDVNAVISVMCGDTTYAATADVNNDGNVNISDVNAVITIMCGGSIE